jgi:hypothetical protein
MGTLPVSPSDGPRCEHCGSDVVAERTENHAFRFTRGGRGRSPIRLINMSRGRTHDVSCSNQGSWMSPGRVSGER